MRHGALHAECGPAGEGGKMNLGGLLLLLYLALGALLAIFVDRAQMGKDVPYGELPALLPLRETRIIIALIYILTGPVVVIPMVAKRFLVDMRHLAYVSRRCVRRHESSRYNSGRL